MGPTKMKTAPHIASLVQSGWCGHSRGPESTSPTSRPANCALGSGSQHVAKHRHPADPRTTVDLSKRGMDDDDFVFLEAWGGSLNSASVESQLLGDRSGSGDMIAPTIQLT